LDVVGDPLVIRIYVGSTLGILNKPNSWDFLYIGIPRLNINMQMNLKVYKIYIFGVWVLLGIHWRRNYMLWNSIITNGEIKSTHFLIMCTTQTSKVECVCYLSKFCLCSMISCYSLCYFALGKYK
jgi:hypothetical protein